MKDTYCKSCVMLISAMAVLFMLSGCTSMGIGSIPLEILKEKYKVKESDFIRVDGIDIHYRDEGKGPPLILLHGICASLYTWDGWVEYLKEDYRIIRMDVPGWGFTGSIGEESYDIKRMTGIMEAFVDKLGLDSFYLAGNSLGGYFCWNYAITHPEQVKKMILLDPVCYPQSTPWFINLARIPLLRALPKIVLPKFLVKMNVNAVYGDTSRITDEIYDLYFDLAMRKGNKTSYVDNFRFMATESKKPSLSEGVAEITIPLLLMYGSEDKWVPPEHARLWKRDVPTSQYIIYDGVGHVPMEEIPFLTAKDAHRFLTLTGY